jgi:nucleotide-binding universal stress UspA family protein
MVFVLAAGMAETTAALHRAAELAANSDSRVIVLVPRIASFTSRDLDSADRSIQLLNQYRDVSARAGVDAGVHICVCRRVEDIFEQLVSEPSTIVIGGRRRGWLRPTAEWHLARTLVARGHDVVFEELHADAGMRPARLLETTS